jgi:hypothetical protein
MSNDDYNEDWGDDEHRVIPKRRPRHDLGARPTYLDEFFDQSIQESMKKALFQLVRDWVTSQVGSI